MTTPHIINKVLPTAYVTVYPSAGVSLSTASCIAPSAAVVVRAPAQHPSVIAGWNLKTYLPSSKPMINGKVVAMAPTMNKLSPTSRKPCTKLGPAAIPTTAMNIFSPTLFSTHREASGIRPNVGCLLRSQPKNNPAINAPPLVLRLMGTPPTVSYTHLTLPTKRIV